MTAPTGPGSPVAADHRIEIIFHAEQLNAQIDRLAGEIAAVSDCPLLVITVLRAASSSRPF